MELDDTICYCFHVTKRKILNHLRIYKPRRASQLSECAGAGTGCGWCRAYLRKYFDESQQSGQVSDDPLTPAEYAWQRAQYVREGKGKPAPGAIPLPDESNPSSSASES